jgi:hypothetical protein
MIVFTSVMLAVDSAYSQFVLTTRPLLLVFGEGSRLRATLSSMFGTVPFS